VRFELDPAKNAINRPKHSLPLDYGDTRFIAIGPIAEFGNRLFFVAYQSTYSECYR
jgi:uncharacterized DUF497 family protein